MLLESINSYEAMKIMKKRSVNATLISDKANLMIVVILDSPKVNTINSSKLLNISS